LHGAIDDATGTGLALTFRPTEDLHGYATLLHTLGTTYGLPLALYGDRFGVFVRNDPHWTLCGARRTRPTSAASCRSSASATSPPTPRKPRAVSNASGKPCKIAS